MRWIQIFHRRNKTDREHGVFVNTIHDRLSVKDPRYPMSPANLFRCFRFLPTHRRLSGFFQGLLHKCISFLRSAGPAPIAAATAGAIARPLSDRPLFALPGNPFPPANGLECPDLKFLQVLLPRLAERRLQLLLKEHPSATLLCSKCDSSDKNNGCAECGRIEWSNRSLTVHPATQNARSLYRSVAYQLNLAALDEYTNVVDYEELDEQEIKAMVKPETFDWHTICQNINKENGATCGNRVAVERGADWTVFRPCNRCSACSNPACKPKPNAKCQGRCQVKTTEGQKTIMFPTFRGERFMVHIDIPNQVGPEVNKWHHWHAAQALIKTEIALEDEGKKPYDKGKKLKVLYSRGVQTICNHHHTLKFAETVSGGYRDVKCWSRMVETRGDTNRLRCPCKCPVSGAACGKDVSIGDNDSNEFQNEFHQLPADIEISRWSLDYLLAHPAARVNSAGWMKTNMGDESKGWLGDRDERHAYPTENDCCWVRRGDVTSGTIPIEKGRTELPTDLAAATSTRASAGNGRQMPMLTVC